MKHFTNFMLLLGLGFSLNTYSSSRENNIKKEKTKKTYYQKQQEEKKKKQSPGQISLLNTTGSFALTLGNGLVMSLSTGQIGFQF